MSIRYTDLDPSKSGASDFVIRKRRPTSQLLASTFAVSLILALLIVNLFADKALIFFLLFAVFSVLGGYVIIVVQRNYDLVLTTEFQNALFASALGLNNKFCIIIRQDGNIAYLDSGFQEMFPNFLKQPHRGIAVLLDLGNVSTEHRGKIFSAVEKGVFDRIVFDISDSKGFPHKIVMSVEPIVRPSGFILLRGREFVEQRNAAPKPATTSTKPASVAAVLSKSNVSLFSYVMDSMDMGVYMAGPAGNIIYASPMLEQWLEYGEGEINSGKTITLKDIIFQGSTQAEKVDLQNFEGEAMLLKKNGGQTKAFINQKVVTNEDGLVIGCTAIVHSLSDHYAEMKKKLW